MLECCVLTILLGFISVCKGFFFVPGLNINEIKSSSLNDAECFADKEGVSGLKFRVYRGQNNSKVFCLNTCKKRWFDAAAVNGDTCWCENDFEEQNKVNKYECMDKRCPGNGDPFCGGLHRKVVMKTGFDFEGRKKVGKCWKEKERSENDASMIYQGVRNTKTYCRQICGAFHKMFAAVRDGDQCWCGNDFFRHGIDIIENCGDLCTGDKSPTCGGAFNIYVMRAERTAMDRGLKIAEGCYTHRHTKESTTILVEQNGRFHNNVVPGFFPTRELCRFQCRRSHLKLAGSLPGNKCSCGDHFNTIFRLTDNMYCDTPCARSETCGDGIYTYVMDSFLEGAKVKFVHWNKLGHQSGPPSVFSSKIGAEVKNQANPSHGDLLSMMFIVLRNVFNWAVK